MKDKDKDEKYKNMVGEKCGKLTILEFIGRNKHQYPIFKCKCDCGNKVEKSYYYLFKNHNKRLEPSCGCLATEYTRNFNSTTKTKFDNKYYKENDYYIIEVIKDDDIIKIKVDDSVLYMLKKLDRKVQIDSRGYAFITRKNSSYKLFLMNIIKCGFDYYDKHISVLVDHINGDITDNRLCNLRIANVFQNTQNARKRKDNSTGIKGINLRIRNNKYKLQCRIQNHKNRIGKIVPFSKIGLKYILLWNIKTRLSLHNEFFNFGFDIKNKTYNQIIKEQTDIFINNLNKKQLEIFNGDEKETNTELEKLKEEFKNINLDEIILK